MPITPRLEEQIRFTGRGSAYFKIWIVNLLLTIVTLGIYSAWAKVRRLHYFYRHTELAGSSFDFHGRPVRILIGRIVGVAMFALYNYAVNLKSLTSIAVIALVALVMPALMRNSLRFRLYNSSWRGTRFHFRGCVSGIYRVTLLNGLLTGLTLGILAPFAHQRLKAYQHGNSWFGRSRFSFHAGIGGFYVNYLIVLATIVAIAIVAGAVGLGSMLPGLAAPKGATPNLPAIFKALAVIWGIVLVISLSVGPVFHAFMTNLIWSNTRLGEHRIDCAMSPWGLIWIVLSNFALTIVTLGFFYPWAKVRLARFQLEAIQLFPAGDLQEFEQAAPEDVGALGEEAASIFDFDISL